MSDDFEDVLDAVLGGSVDNDSVDSAFVPDARPGALRQIQNNPDNLVAEVEREGYAWAADCFWVYNHLGQKVTKAQAGRRWAMWLQAKKDVSDFIQQIMPKAMTLLEKARDKAGDNDTVERVERKEIAKLQSILDAAIVEAAEMRAAGTL